jgi:hypothetical protein
VILVETIDEVLSLRLGSTTATRRATTRAALGAVLVAAVAGAQIARTPVEPLEIRLEGRVGAPDPKHRAAADVTFLWSETRIRFQVARAIIVRDEALGADFLAEIAPYGSTLILQGDDAVIGRLRAASVRDRVTVTGYHRTGDRTFMVSRVDVTPPAH